jgi:arabinofuranosyltransferase
MPASSRVALSVSLAVSLALAAALLVFHSLQFNFVTDDAFISFVYAKNLVNHGALVFNLGERVEGYTNFLWTLLVALGLALRIPAELSSRVLGTLCAVATMVFSAWLLRRLRGGSYSLWESLPAWILAGIPGYACWASGGLETQLFTLLSTLAIGGYLHAVLTEKEADQAPLIGIGVAIGLAALTRPEGYLLCALIGLHRLILKIQRREWLPTKEEWKMLLIFLLLTVPHVVWRRLYYGYYVPNTFYIKSSGGQGTWQQGGYYLWAFARDLKLWVLPLLWILGLLRPLPASRQRAIPNQIPESQQSPVLTQSPESHKSGYGLCGGLLLLWAGPFLLYVASVGGDFMGLYRFVMPIVPLAVLAGGLGIWRLLCDQPLLLRVAVLLLAAGLHGANSYVVDRHALTFLGADRGIDTPGYLRHYTADRALIGKWLGQHVQQDDYQVVGGAGAQVYYAGIAALDSFGLSDAYVAHHAPAVSSRPGHQKFAPLDYVLSRKPTILTYNVYKLGNAPYRPSAQEEAEWRARGFHYVSVQIPGLSQPWYSFLKRVDRRLGPLPLASELSGGSGG